MIEKSKLRNNIKKAQPVDKIASSFKDDVMNLSDIHSTIKVSHPGIMINDSTSKKNSVEEIALEEKEKLIETIKRRNYERARYLYIVFVVLSRTLSWGKRKVIEDRYLQGMSGKEIMKELPDPSRDFIIRQTRKGANPKKVSREINQIFQDINLDFTNLVFPTDYKLSIFLESVPTEDEIERLQNIEKGYWCNPPEINMNTHTFKESDYSHIKVEDVYEILDSSTSMSMMLSAPVLDLIHRLKEIRRSAEQFIDILNKNLSEFVPSGRKRMIGDNEAKAIKRVLLLRFVEKKPLFEIANVCDITEDTCTRYIKIADDYFCFNQDSHNSRFGRGRLDFVKSIVDYYNYFYDSQQQDNILEAIEDENAFEKYMSTRLIFDPDYFEDLDDMDF